MALGSEDLPYPTAALGALQGTMYYAMLLAPTVSNHSPRDLSLHAMKILFLYPDTITPDADCGATSMKGSPSRLRTGSHGDRSWFRRSAQPHPQRNISRENLLTTFRMLKEAGIKVQTYNIVGSPHETARQILETLKINAEIDPEWMQHSIFYPYEGTPLHDLVHREGLVSKNHEVLDYFRDTVLEQDCIRPAQVVMFQKYFKGFVRHYQRMERLPKPVRGIAIKATDFFLSRNSAPKFLNASSRLASVFRSNGNRKNDVHTAS